MKRFLMVAAAMLALTGRGQVAMRALEDIDNVDLVCVTNYGPQVVSLTARVTGLEGSSNDWSKTVSNLAALSNNVSALSSRVTDTNAMFSAWFSGLHSRTSYWDTAYFWGDWHAAVASNSAAIAVLQTNTVTRAGTNGFVTASITNGLASASYVASAVSGLASITITNGLASTSYVAAAVAAIQAADAFWPHNATASSRLTFITNSGAITITGYNIDDGGTDVVIPDYINGWPVTAVGANAFMGSGLTSIGGAGNVVTVEDSAFNGCISLASVSLPLVQTVGEGAFVDCPSLTSVSLPQVQTVGASAFGGCASMASVSLPQVQTVGYAAFSFCTLLTSVSLPLVQTVGDYAFGGCGGLTSLYFDNDAPTIGDDIFAEITTPNQVTNYVTNPTATGWGDTLGDMPGMPVVRLPLYADALTLGGVTHTNWPSADVSGLAPTNSPTILNPTVHGWIALPQSAPTNLVLRLVSSNEHIIVQEVYQ